jgi:hypothetical protein
MSEYGGYKGEFKEEEWLCDDCFSVKLKRINKRREREGKSVYKDREV